MKYYIIAGEASGDLHASNLIAQLKKKDPEAQIRAWGGDLMRKQGAELVKHYRHMAYMGFVEVLLNLGAVLRNLRECKNDILQYAPDVVILVDYPGFNLRIAEFAHQQGVKVVYYISPQVWAWKQRRVKKIKKSVNKMLVILPFEEDFYKEYEVDVAYVGNPLLDELSKLQDSNRRNFLRRNNLGEKREIIALLPGSRKQEISKMLEVMLKVVPRFPKYQFVIAGAPSMEKEFYKKYMGNVDVSLVENQTYELLQNASAAIVTSGTATLETALLGVPEVVCYKGSPISYRIAKRLVKVKYISLVNLIMNKAVVKELIQNDLTEDAIVGELKQILTNPKRQKQILDNYDSLRGILGNSGASEKAANEILYLLRHR